MLTDNEPSLPAPPADVLERRRWVQRAFVVVWMTLGLAGALNHTIAQRVMGHRYDLVLPQLKWGYVMFNQNPQRVRVHEYEGADGIRHDLADLLLTPSLGYGRARVEINSMVQPKSIQELCRQAIASGVGIVPVDPARGSRASSVVDLTFVETEYNMSAGVATPARTTLSRCDAHGLRRR